MQRVLDLRITRWGWKLIYVVAAVVIAPVPAQLGTSLGAYDLGFFIGSILRIGLFLLAARIFRGRDEAVTPARPWWQMTARPTLSRRLGIFLAVLTGLNVLATVLQLLGAIGSGSTLIASIISVLECGLLAFLYLNSATRLRRRSLSLVEPMPRQKRIPII